MKTCSPGYTRPEQQTYQARMSVSSGGERLVLGGPVGDFESFVLPRYSATGSRMW